MRRSAARGCTRRGSPGHRSGLSATGGRGAAAPPCGRGRGGLRGGSHMPYPDLRVRRWRGRSRWRCRAASAGRAGSRCWPWACALGACGSGALSCRPRPPRPRPPAPAPGGAGGGAPRPRRPRAGARPAAVRVREEGRSAGRPAGCSRRVTAAWRWACHAPGPPAAARERRACATAVHAAPPVPLQAQGGASLEHGQRSDPRRGPCRLAAQRSRPGPALRRGRLARCRRRAAG
jgi:hypothetical protein